MYAPSVVHVGLYFDKKRGIANGIASSGSGLGVFILPPLCEAIFSQYGFTGTFLIMGALMLNSCVSAMLYRPIQLSQDLPHDQIHSGVDSKHETVTGLQKYLDYKLLKDFNYLAYVISLGMCIGSFLASQILVADQAILCGISEARASILLGVIGISDAIGRVSSGFLFDWQRLRPFRYHVFNITILISAFTISGWIFVYSFEALVLLCVVYGFLFGFVTAQRIVILADIVGVEKLSSAFGLSTFFQGVGTLIYPLFAGYLRDVTGSYTASFIFLGGSQIVSFVFLYLGHFYSAKRSKVSVNI